MLEYMAQISSQVAVLFIMIASGFVLFKWGGLKKEYLTGFTTVLLYLITPALLIDSMTGVEFSAETATELLMVFAIATVVHLLAYIITLPLFRRDPQKKRVVYRAAVILSNAGFMSLPLASALIGPKGVFLVSVYVMVFNLFVWTVVYGMFNPGKFNVKKLLLNPGIIGVSIGAFLFFTGIRLPSMISSAVGYLAGMNTPLAMITIGGMIAVGGITVKKEEILCMVQSISLRLLVLPLIVLAALLPLGLDPQFTFAVMIPVCAPVAANTAIFASQFNADGPLGSKLLAVSTVASVFTMPFILALTRWLSV